MTISVKQHAVLHILIATTGMIHYGMEKVVADFLLAVKEKASHGL